MISSLFKLCIIFVLGLFPCFISHIVCLLEIVFVVFSARILEIVCFHFVSVLAFFFVISLSDCFLGFLRFLFSAIVFFYFSLV